MSKGNGGTRRAGVSSANGASKNMPTYMKKTSSGEETWYEGRDGETRVRVLQEEDSNNKWWNLEVDSQYVKNADGRAMSFETPQEAMNEYLNQRKKRVIHNTFQ